jgi:hypothetical protein
MAAVFIARERTGPSGPFVPAMLTVGPDDERERLPQHQTSQKNDGLYYNPLASGPSAKLVILPQVIGPSSRMSIMAPALPAFWRIQIDLLAELATSPSGLLAPHKEWHNYGQGYLPEWEGFIGITHTRTKLPL